MEQIIRNEIRRFVLESPANRFPDGRRLYFEEPLVGFASAEDELFRQYKSIIGEFHLTPAEVMADAHGPEAAAATVVTWILPISKATRKTNAEEKKMPSWEWAMTRSQGEKFNTLLRMHMTRFLTEKGFLAVAPLLSALWRPVNEAPAGMASTWSERHAAYAAGLGTFSLNDGLITRKGIAHRCGSVITDAALTPTPRTCSDPWSYCLFFSEGKCGACIDRCPVGAISSQGHDKDACMHFAYNELRNTAGQLYCIMETGCGLCQTGVPCESKIPGGGK